MTTTNKTGEAGPVASEGTAGPVATVTVRYAISGTAMTVRTVGSWMRGQVAMVMSSSSGPKDYIKNMMCAVLDGQPNVEEIRMLCGEYRTSIPFCVFRVGARWFDCSQREVVFA